MTTSKESLFRSISQLTWADFTADDWSAYAGCETDNPRIASDDENIYIIDGDTLTVIEAGKGDGGTLYKLSEV